jgi:hypothetical protein
MRMFPNDGHPACAADRLVDGQPDALADPDQSADRVAHAGRGTPVSDRLPLRPERSRPVKLLVR